MRIVIDVHFVMDGTRYHVRPSRHAGHYEWAQDYDAQQRTWDAVPYGHEDYSELEAAAQAAQVDALHRVSTELHRAGRQLREAMGRAS